MAFVAEGAARAKTLRLGRGRSAGGGAGAWGLGRTHENARAEWGSVGGGGR